MKREYGTDGRQGKKDVNWFTQAFFESRLENEIEEYQTIFNEPNPLNDVK